MNEKLAILVGGGPAPGINSVIGAATIRACLSGVEVLGIQDGFKWLIDGDTSRVTALTIADTSRIHFRGGSYLGISPANNFCGHGFYQFGPDLFYRIFSAENGFRVERVILCAVRADGEWFEVLDPLGVRQFVESLGTTEPTYLLIHAKKLEDAPLFRKYPEQSVYTLLWKGEYPGEDHTKLILPGSRI